MPKKYPDEYKKMIVKEVEELGSISEVAKKYKLNFSLIYRWKKLNGENINKKVVQQINFEEIKKEKELKRNEIENLINENLRLKELVLKKEIEFQKLKDIIRCLI